MSENTLQNLGELQPKDHQFLFGHANAEKLLSDAYHSGKCPHAVILVGPPGVGKATLALRFARKLLFDDREAGKIAAEPAGMSLFGDEPAPAPVKNASSLEIPTESKTFHQIAAMSHPAFLYVGRPFDEKKGKYKSEIPVDDIRKIPPFMRMKPTEGTRRIAMVDDAHTMNRNSQNAILKILEEPPENALLILVATNLGAFLPTIRSRCRVIDIKPPSVDECAGYLQKVFDECPDETARQYSALYHGCIGRAISAYERKENDLFDEVFDVASAVIEKNNRTALRQFAEKYGKAAAQEQYQTITTFLPGFIEETVSAWAKGAGASPYTSAPARHFVGLLERLRGNPQKLLETVEKMKASFNDAENAYLDNRRVFELAMVDLAQGLR